MFSYLLNETVYEYLEEYHTLECKLISLNNLNIISEISAVDVANKEADIKNTAKNIKDTPKNVKDVTEKFVKRNGIAIFIERAKENFKNLLLKFAALFKKFIDAIYKRAKGDKEWLIKYKDKIFNVNVELVQLDNIHPYWKGNEDLKKANITRFRENDRKFLKASESKDTLMSYLLKDMSLNKIVLNNNESFSESLRKTFRGGEQVKLTSRELARLIPEMYGYCLKYDDIKKYVEKERNEINISIKQIIQILSKPISSNDMYQQANDEGVTIPKRLRNDEDIKKCIKMYNNYLVVSNQIIGAKLDIYQEKYTEYMNIMNKVLHDGYSQTKKQKDSSNTAHKQMDQEKENVKNSKILPKFVKKKTLNNYEKNKYNKEVNIKEKEN